MLNKNHRPTLLLGHRRRVVLAVLLLAVVIGSRGTTVVVQAAAAAAAESPSAGIGRDDNGTQSDCPATDEAEKEAAGENGKINDIPPAKGKYSNQNPPQRETRKSAPYNHDPLRPGQVSTLIWADDDTPVQEYAARVGLPDKLVPTVRRYAEKLGIIDLMKRHLYGDPAEFDDGKFYRTPNPHVASPRKDMLWYSQRPGEKWRSDLHWFAAGDEYTHESTLRVLADGDFDVVLDGLADFYELDGIGIDGVAFQGITYCEKAFFHADMTDTGGKYFNLLFPVVQVEGAGPELVVAGERVVSRTDEMDDDDDDDEEGDDDEYEEEEEEETEMVDALIKHDPHIGVLVGDDTYHASNECDHRPQNAIRIALSIYFHDLNEDNFDAISVDDTSVFPLPGINDWTWTQQGRHWGRGKSVAGDLGRTPWEVEDESDDCPAMVKRGECESDPFEIRPLCPKSCEVFMDDEEYRPGVERRIVMGDITYE